MRTYAVRTDVAATDAAATEDPAGTAIDRDQRLEPGSHPGRAGRAGERVEQVGGELPDAGGAVVEGGLEQILIAVGEAVGVVAAQSIVSRNVDPLQNAVVSICVVQTDSTAHNVIPQVVRLKGTARSLDGAVRDQLEAWG